MYSAEISVTKGTPGCLVFLIDQSGSMKDTWGRDSTRRKCDAVAIAVNRLLDTTIAKCVKSDGVRNYFDVSVIGYGPGNRAQFALRGMLAGKEIVPVSALEEHAHIVKIPKKVDAGDGTLIETEIEMPTWFDPIADNGTPMHDAFRLAEEVLRGWCSEHSNSFPPVVFNITDGEPNDMAAAELAADDLLRLSTLDGNILLFNIHISESAGSEIAFPEDDSTLPDKFAKFLFRISSPLPAPFVGAARQASLPAQDGSRGFLFNADAVKLIEFLDVGTRVVQGLLR